MPAFTYEEYHISTASGFVFDGGPGHLPEYFKPWEDLATNMADFVEKRIMREETLKIPQLDSSRLQTVPELRLAHLQLSFITIGYAWQEYMVDPVKSIPANIAVPFCDICDRIGLEPGAADVNFCGNWKFIDKNGPLELENLESRYGLPGGDQISKFWLLCSEIVGYGYAAVPTISNILEAFTAKDSAAVATELRNFAKWFNVMEEKCKRFKDVTDPAMFFKYVGQFAKGFNEINGYPDGMLYEGVTNNPRRKTINVSGGQTVVIPTIERILGLTYADAETEHKRFWRTIIPVPHQKFLKFIFDSEINVKPMVDEAGPTSDLAAAYNECLKAFSDFRSYHIQLATRYFILPNKKDRQERNDTSEDPMAPLIPRLKSYRTSTDESKVGQ